MHETVFADSALPPAMECLGLPLADYTLGHELVLLHKRSPFLLLTRAEFDALPMTEQVSAITFAVQVCARQPAFRWPFSAFLWRRRRHDYALAIVEFRIYLMANRQLMPCLSSDQEADAEAYEIANKGDKMSGGRQPGSPFLAQLINFCLDNLRLTYQEALESPFGVTANLYFAAMEAKGQMIVENQKETDARAEMAKHRAEVEAENARARQEWAAATTPEEQKAAYERNPRIGMVFGAEWRAATDDAARAALVERWGIVAITELERAGIRLPVEKGVLCPD